jgi:hypothetical protein
MVLNILKKNDSDLETNFGASKWSHFEYEKSTFGALERAIKIDLLLIFCCNYTDRVSKTSRIHTEGFSFAEKSPGTNPTYVA